MAVRVAGDPRESTVGYWSGSPPKFGGQGSMAGPSTTMRQTMTSVAGQWHPTVATLLVLVVLEVIVFGALRYAFRGSHGG